MAQHLDTPKSTALEVGTMIAIESSEDIVSARQRGRELAAKMGFSTVEQAAIVTVISELGKNILQYAGSGVVGLMWVVDHGKEGLSVMALDDGPGIPDVMLAMQDGYSTSGGFGLGLSGVRRLMDEFEIKSSIGRGTKIVAKKWLRSYSPVHERRRLVFLKQCNVSPRPALVAHAS